MRAAVGAALMLGVLAAGCSTRYAPAPGPRLSVIMKGGKMVYTRDGEEFEYGFFGGGLADAVADDPAALEAAETFESRNITGFGLTLGGLACLIAGTALITASALDDQGGDDTSTALGIGALGCGLALPIAGASVTLSGMPYQWDAINLYNDGAEERARREQWRAPSGYGGPAPPEPRGRGIPGQVGPRVE